MTRSGVGRRLLGEAGPARPFLAATVAFGLALTGLIIAQAGLLATILASAAHGFGVAALARPIELLLVVLAVRGLCVYGSAVTATRAAVAVKARLRSRLIRHVLRLGPAWLAGNRAGAITTLAGSGLDSLDPYFASYLPQLLLAVAVPITVLITVTATDWLSGLIIALTLPLIPVFAVLIGQRVKSRASRQWQLLARLSGHFLDVVQGLATLKVFGRTRAEEQVIGDVTMAYRASVMATLKVAFLSALVLELSAALATALVAVEVGIRLLYGHLGYSTALLVLLLTPEAFLPLRAAGAGFHASAEGTAAAADVFEILDTPATATPAAARPATASPQLSGRPAVADLRTDTITLSGVSVAYPGRAEPALDQVSLVIRPGELITLTGPSGSGKTTLLNLLLRFTPPAAGTICAGGTDLADLTVDSWRAQLAWLPQQPWLFPWSVAQNIALGRPIASGADIERAAGLAGAARFIEALPQGYDTTLDERALRLSAGQRQKIALARLFLRDAPLVLLDEPTAHLDPVSAAEIDDAIGTLMRGRTVIWITHRAGAAVGCERRLVIRDGVLTEPAGPALEPEPGLAGSLIRAASL
jgi:ATP-binding cassette subfamily C protein CydD